MTNDLEEFDLEDLEEDPEPPIVLQMSNGVRELAGCLFGGNILEMIDYNDNMLKTIDNPKFLDEIQELFGWEILPYEEWDFDRKIKYAKLLQDTALDGINKVWGLTYE